MIKASVIVPTRNRAAHLQGALRSLVRQTFPVSSYEILVIDNGSTDDTKQVTQALMAQYPSNHVKYISEPVPGLLSGRHRGALEAKGEILAFVDDDIEAIESWLEAVVEAFDNGSVHMVGGPSLPKFEVEPPLWISRYWTLEKGRLNCGSLSLLDLGDTKFQVDPVYVWGLNLSIRKQSLLDLGGFHPDCIPKELQAFQGDGETGLGLKLKAKGLQALYAPGAKVYHLVPRERMTVAYFENRFYYQGVADSYTQIRQKGSVEGISLPVPDGALQTLPCRTTYDRYRQIIFQRINKAYVEGFLFHHRAVRGSEALLEWALRDNYFDYRLPDICLDFQKIGTPGSADSQPFPQRGGLQDQDTCAYASMLMEKAKTCMEEGDFASALSHLQDIEGILPDLTSLGPLKDRCLLQLGKQR